MSPEEKASLVQLAGACALCLDWTGDHKAKDCQAEVGVTAVSSHVRKLPGTVKTSCGVKATIVSTQVEKPKRKELYDALNEKPPVEEETMEVDEEDQDYSEVVSDLEFLPSVL